MLTDSRADFSGGGGLFTAIIGEKTDGHRYIPQVIEKGAACVLLSEPEWIPETVPAGSAFVLVDRVERAMLDIALCCRQSLDIPFVSVTGSVGKTTTREMTAEALSAGFRTFRTPKNFNGQVGIPVTFMSIADEEIAVLEAGISLPGEMKRLARVIRPDTVIMTNIGVSHIEFLGSREGIFEEKFDLARELSADGLLIVNGDDDILGAKDLRLPCPVIRAGLGEGNDVRAVDIAERADGSSFTAVFPDARVRVDLKVSGEHMVRNALLALAAADHYHVPLKAAAAKLSGYEGFEGRQKIEESGGVRFICDYYNASPDSMRAALKVLKDLPGAGRRVAVLGNMLELGPDSLKYHREVGALAADCADTLVTVGDLAEEMAAGALEKKPGMEVKRFADTDAAAAAADGLFLPGDAVLLKASNSMKLGRLKETWEDKHRSTQM